MVQPSDEALLADHAAQVTQVLLAAVEATLDKLDVERSRLLLDITDESESGRVTELLLTLVSVRWLTVAREQTPDGVDPVEPVLAWIAEHLGKRYAARARYTSAPLRSEDAAADVMNYRDALGLDFFPSMAWQLAAVVALRGDGDVDWLRRLVNA